jgi:hypothetical protein
MNPELLKYYIALQPFFRERMGEWRAGDRYTFLHSKEILLVGTRHFHSHACGEAIWLPRTIDDSNPEAQKRSLVGMLEDDYVLSESRFEDGNICTCTIDCKIFEGATPTEAILRALCAQWEVEI